jgi:hypothetical protein
LLQSGITISLRKPVLIGFAENRENQKSRLIFSTKFNFQIFGKKLKTEQFSVLSISFSGLSIDFSTGFLFKIQNLNENSKPISFLFFVCFFLFFSKFPN